MANAKKIEHGDNSECYIYRGAIYCKTCGESIRERLISEGKSPVIDSDSFPQGPYPVGEADYPQHCDRCQVFMENPLTEDGYKYVQEQVNNHCDNNEVVQEWADYYGIKSEVENETE